MTQLGDIKGFKGYTYLFWNARSLVPRLEEIQRIIDEGSPEIIGINETWLSDKIDNNEISFDGYLNFRADRTKESKKTGGGGLLFYCKQRLDVECLSEYTKCTPDIECLWLGLNLINTKQIVIGLIYRPPSGKVENFIEILEDICLNLRSKRNCEINFGGDMNIDWTKRDLNVRKYKESLRRMGLNQTICDFTHVSDTTMNLSLIDHFVTSDIELYSNSGTIPHGATDHYLVYATRKKAHVKHETDVYKGRAYGKMDKVKFCYDIITNNWDDVYNEMNPNQVWINFKAKFVETIDKHAPYKYFNSRKDRQPWVTTEFL